MFKKKKIVIGVVGLGYTGLPLALQFGKYFKTIGFDINKKKVDDLNHFIDSTNETNPSQIKKFLNKNFFTYNESNLKNVNVFIVAVPTPVTKKKLPDLTFLKNASNIIGNYIKKNSIVVYESTVYPGCTEDVCIKILEEKSNLRINKDFYCGYSPERINPGDKKRKIENIIKITSGSNKRSASFIDSLYKKIIKAGTFQAKDIKTAEAAKVIENIQRDLNIAFVNELSMIFRKLKISTTEVLEAASTKWNFSKYTPGLVGGHCISVDPYYLTYIAKKNKINPKVILAGRKINDSMPYYVVNEIKKKIKNNYKKNCLILGLSFKENCPDIRNSKVFELINEFKKLKIEVSGYDPIVDYKEVENKYNFRPLKKIRTGKKYDFVILAVKHSIFKKMENSISKKLKKGGFVFDIKSYFKKKEYIDTL
ncbi:nucleotide sugar dehydrogenase [Pelagibacterales bacterium SAG-MED21]|nr:nucleotide sugar dehydrogenase [Pelagibacterales bacterium SAG-MED21]